MSQKASVAGKIILSGEYAVAFGYPGIAVPSSLQLTALYEAGSNDLIIEWPDVDPRWIDYAKKVVTLLEEQTEKTYSGTLRIENQLPLGKGMGSSTALAIAITQTLGRTVSADCNRHLRGWALKIEDTVNPGQSGIDFHTIWSGKPILFQKSEAPVEAYISLDFLKGTLLIDSGSPDQTTKELVAWMKTREAEVTPIFERIAECTEQFLEGEDPAAIIREHHRAQVELGVVPEPTQKLIAEIEKAGGAAKVIGAGGRSGGGGMILALGTEAKEIAKKHAMMTHSL